MVLQLKCVGLYENLLQKAVFLGIMLVIKACDIASNFLISKGSLCQLVSGRLNKHCSCFI